MIELRQYQTTSIEAMRQNIRDGHIRQVLVAPTGSGKSIIMLDMIQSAIAKNKRCLFICERRNLVEQFSTHLDSQNIDHGILMAKHWRFKPEALVQVASAQTLEKMESWPAIDFVFLDELHVLMRKSIINMLETRPTLKVIGSTATPFNPLIQKYFTAVVSVTTMRELVDDGNLVPFRVFVAHEVDTTGVKVVAGEWQKDELEKRGQRIVGDIVQDYLDLSQSAHNGQHKKTICFSAGIAHGAELAQKFQDVGVNAIQLASGVDETFRLEVMTEFAKEDSGIDMLISVDMLARGFDQTDIEHVILARPLRKSFSQHVQMVGRGARPHNGKSKCIVQDHCIASGSKVLTQRGLINIELILISDTIWDGHEFVNHKGVISRGIRPVIKYAGLTATADHLVKTREGWSTLGYCSEKQTPIISTGIGRTAIRECENHFRSGCVAWAEAPKIHACFVRVRNMWLQVNNFIFQSARWCYKRMQTLQSAQKDSAMAPVTVFCNGAKVQESESEKVFRLWWKGNRIQVRLSDCLRSLDSREFGVAREFQRFGIRQDRQQRALRGGKFAMVNPQNEHEQYPRIKVESINSQIQITSPGNPLRRLFASIFSFCRDVVRTNHREIQKAEQETEREVWDILDCGPRNSFTCEGLLVHNSGNWLRFLPDWNELYHNGVTELTGEQDKKPRKEPTEKEKKASKCPKCGCIMSGDTCAHCGHVREKQNKAVTVAGEILELTGSEKPEKFSSEFKERFYQEMIGYLHSRGKNIDAAFYWYKTKFHVEPKWKKTPIPPSLEVVNYCRSRMIAYAKKMGAKK